MKIDVILEAGLPESQVEALAVQAERHGINRLWVASFPSRRDPLPALVLAARATKRLLLATLPVSPYEIHPLRIADQLLTLNELSQGRASMLIGGLGHSVGRVTGLKPARRVTAVRETVTILKGLRPDTQLDFQGELYSLLNYRADWATAPRPRIYAGATQEKMTRMAASIADGIMCSDAPLGRMPDIMRWVHAGLAAGNRKREELALSNFMAWHVKRDRAAAVAEARRELIWRGFLMPWFTEPFLGDAMARQVEARKPAFLKAFLSKSPQIEGVPEAVIEQLVRHMTLTGDESDIERIAEDLHALGKAGMDEVALRLHDDPAEGLRLIGEQLMPALGAGS